MEPSRFEIDLAKAFIKIGEEKALGNNALTTLEQKIEQKLNWQWSVLMKLSASL
jgi:hypothetical protein